MCDHEFVKVIDIPVGIDDDGHLYRIPPCCVRWLCVHCGAYEDELEESA